MNTCEATPSAAQEIRIQSLGTPEIDSPLSRNLATAGERRVVFTVDEELVDEGAAPRPMSFELAGPRDRIYFDPSKTKCAIVTCGGLCPGINDVIRAIVMTAYNAYRVPSVLGIRYGLQGFIPSYRYDVRELAPRDVEGIHEFGGTILGTSRGPQSSSEIATALERLNISALFIIGGDGTMKAAASIQQEVARRGKHISIVGIPKTIDNDLVLVCDQAFEDHIYDGIEFVAPCTLPGMWERTLTVCSISKGIGLSGFRIGYIYACDKIMDVLYGGAVNVLGAACTLSSLGAIAAIKDKEHMRSNYERLERRRRLAYDILSTAPGVEMKMSESGILSWLNISRLGTSAEVADYIMEHAKIMVNQGTPYGAQGEGWLRIVTACFASDEDAAVRFERIKAALTRLAKEKGIA